MAKFKQEEYKQFIKYIKERIRQSQYEALRAVNKQLINLYWDIGKKIVEKQKEYNWGKSIVENLSNDLQKELPGIQGLSKDNIWRMRKFYLYYSKNKKLASLVQEISWVKNIVIYK